MLLKISGVQGLQATLDAKEGTITPGLTTQYWRGDKTWQVLDKAAVGLSNVDNTSDANKPVSTATQSALALKIDISQKGVSDGIATLDSGGKVPSSQLPSFVLTDIYSVASQAAQLALTAQEGDVAVRTDLSKTYMHNGGTAGTMADWTELLSPTTGVTSFNTRQGAVTLTSLDVTGALGYTPTSVNNLTGIQTAANFKAGLSLVKADVGLGNVDNTSDANKPVSTAQQTALNLKLNTSDYTGAEILNKITTVDGAGSGLDADLLDGLQASAFPTLAALTNTFTGNIVAVNGTFSGTMAVTGALSASNFSGSSSGTNTGDQTTITGNAGSATILQTSRNFSISGGGVTAAAVGFNGSANVVLSASVDAGHITLARMANLGANTIIGNNTGVSAVPLALTPTQVTAMLDLAIAGGAKGLLSGADKTKLDNFSGTSSGTNTGDQTTITGNAGTATALQTARNFSISGGGITAATVAFDGTAAVVLSASVDAGHITLARMANLAANSIIGNNTGAGATPLALTATQVTAMLDLAIAGGAKGLLSGTDKTKLDNTSGTNTGDQTITLSGDISGSGTGAITTTIGANKVTLAMMAQMATASFLGRNTAATGNVEVLSAATARTMLSINNVDNTSDATKNVLSATKLTTARTINGVSFDGTANISIVDPNYTASDVLTKLLTVDGAGTGLDADLLDGVQGSAFAQLASSPTFTGSYVRVGAASAGQAELRAGTATTPGSIQLFDEAAAVVGVIGGEATTATRFRMLTQNGMTGFEFYAAPYVGSNVMWHAGNDGSGSGLDADLLDGYDSTAFPRLNGNTAFTANITNSGNFGTTNANGYLSKNGTASNPTFILRNDGTNLYFLASAAGTALNETWNALRPLTIDLVGGAISSANGQNFGGGMTNSGVMYLTHTQGLNFSPSGTDRARIYASNSASELRYLSGAHYFRNLTDTAYVNIFCNDVYADRGDGTGVIFFGGGAHYLYWNNSAYVFQSGGLSTAGDIQMNAAGAIYGVQTPNNGTTGGIVMRANGTSTYAYMQIVNNTGGSQYSYLRWASDGAMYHSGYIQAAGNIIAYASDGRLKNNLRPIDNPIDKLMKVGGYLFDWDMELSAEAGFTPRNQTEHGLIAQEWLEVMPDSVVPAAFNDNYYTMMYERTIPLLIEVGKNHEERIKALEAELETLRKAS